MEISKIIIPKDSVPLIEGEDRDIISSILDDFSSFCHTKEPKEITVRQEKVGFRDDPPKKDTVSKISKDLISNFIPSRDRYFHQPYNSIDRKFFFYKNNDEYQGFLLACYDIGLLKEYFNKEIWREEQRFNQIKYETMLGNTDKIKEKFNCDVKLIWLELLCVNETYRGKGISEDLVNSLIKDAIETYKDDNNIRYIIIAIDLAGTDNYWYNETLANFYNKKLNFTILFNTGLELISGGAQLGYIQLERINDEFIQNNKY